MRMIVLVLLFIFPVLSFSDDGNQIMLRWTSFPGHKYLHEFYVKEGRGLYLVRKEEYEQPRSDYFPNWSAFSVEKGATDEIVAVLNKLISEGRRREADKVAKMRLCNGVQWSIDIKYGSYDEQFNTRCDTVETYDKLQNMVKTTIKSVGE